MMAIAMRGVFEVGIRSQYTANEAGSGSGIGDQRSSANGAGRMHSQVQQVPRNHMRGMPGDIAFIKIVSEDGTAAELFDRIEIGDDLGRALQCVFRLHLVWRRTPVNERVVEDLRLRVAVQGADVVGSRQAKTLIC